MSLFRAGFIFLSLHICACSSKLNTVRLDGGVWSLTTEHYLSVDEDKLLELDKGERSIAFQFKRVVRDEIQVSARLYDTDKDAISRMRIIADGKTFDFPSLVIERELQSEQVTILDSGQRREDNPNLATSAQAQTGYITFGKPGSAGVAKRYWITYRFRIAPVTEMRTAILRASKVSVVLDFGPNLAEAQVDTRQLRAWKRYFNAEYDEKNAP